MTDFGKILAYGAAAAITVMFVASVRAEEIIDSSCGTQKVHVQYRGSQNGGYVPFIDPSERLSTIENPVLVIRSSYVEELEVGGKDSYSLSGLRKRGNTLQLATPAGQAVPYGTSVSLGCEGGVYAGGVVLNTEEKETSIVYGGPNVQYGYTYKWPGPAVEGGIKVSFASHTPYWQAISGAPLGGDVATIVRFVKQGTGEVISFVIRAYGLSPEQGFEERFVGFDPNDGAAHITTNFGGTKYVDAKGPVSTGYTRLFKKDAPVFADRFEATISPGHLETALADAFGRSEDARKWRLQYVGMTFEVNDNNGTALVAGAFSDFEVERLPEAVTLFTASTGVVPGLPSKGTPVQPTEPEVKFCPGNKWQRQLPPCGRAVPFYED